MTIPKEAVERAIAGGWNPNGSAWLVQFALIDARDEDIRWQHVALDPSFWQALGKALRWGTLYCLKCDQDFLFPDARCKCKRSSKSNVADWAERKDWMYHARRFYDLILTGQPTEDYWRELLNV